jgi:hypothetical protein
LEISLIKLYDGIDYVMDNDQNVYLFEQFRDICHVFCAWLKNEMEKSNQTYDEAILKKHLEMLFFKQYYSIKKRIVSQPILHDQIPSDVVNNDISQHPKDMLYFVRYHEKNSQSHKEERLQDVEKTVSAIKYIDGTVEKTITTREVHSESKDNTSATDRVPSNRYNVIYMHKPSELDRKYTVFFKQFIDDFIKSNVDCNESDVYPWPNIAVLRKGKNIWFKYSGKKSIIY